MAELSLSTSLRSSLALTQRKLDCLVAKTPSSVVPLSLVAGNGALRNFALGESAECEVVALQNELLIAARIKRSKVLKLSRSGLV